MTDLITRLRTWSHARHAAPASDLMDEAADEIERLRSRLRFADAVIRSGGVASLTSAERTTIQRLAEDYEKDGEPASEGCVAAMRGLLERL